MSHKDLLALDDVVATCQELQELVLTVVDRSRAMEVGELPQQVAAQGRGGEPLVDALDELGPSGSSLVLSQR